jgi:hypothetical protein
MSEAGIVAFEHPELGNACDELEALGPDFTERLLRYLQRVQSKDIDHRTLQPFATYQGVEMFLATTGDDLAVFSVEVDTHDDLKISIMFAGRRKVPIARSPLTWDGNDFSALRTNIIFPRAAAWFD